MRKFNHHLRSDRRAGADGSLAACGGGDKNPKEPRRPRQPRRQKAGAAPVEVAHRRPATLGQRRQKVYSLLCIACHGPEGKGVQGLGKDLTTSTFVAEKTDAELVEFIKVGRQPDDPLNTTGVAMPPKGGNPALSDQEIADIVAFVRTIHQ